MREQRGGSRGASAVVVSAVLMFTLVACGYRPLTGGAVFGPDVRTIEVEAFENESTAPGLEQQVADAMVEEFARRAWLEPVLQGQVANPDLVMSGLLRTANVRSNSYSPGGLALEERIEVHFDVSVKRSASGQVVYRHPGFSVGEVFLSSADPMVYASNKEQALRRVASLIAERVHDELFQKF